MTAERNVKITLLAEIMIIPAIVVERNLFIHANVARNAENQEIKIALRGYISQHSENSILSARY